MSVCALWPRLLFAWQAQYTEPPEEVAARVVALWPRLLFAWQAQYTETPGEAAARMVALRPRLLFAWQAQYAETPGEAAARVVALKPRLLFDALHRASGKSCGARGRSVAAAGLSPQLFWRLQRRCLCDRSASP